MKLKTKTIRPGTQIRETAYARPTVNIWGVSERAAVTTSLGTFHFEMNLLGASDAAQVVSQSYGLNGVYGPTQFLILTLDKCGWRRLKKTYVFFLIGGHADFAPHHPLEILNECFPQALDKPDQSEGPLGKPRHGFVATHKG